jgi:exosortase
MAEANQMTTLESKRWEANPVVLCAGAALLVVFGWTYRDAAIYFLKTWWHQAEYGHGFFVPIFSLFLLWHRRSMVTPFPTNWSWWALPMFALSALIRWATVYFNYSIDHYSLFPLFVGLALLVGGWRGLHWAWQSIVFLIFMVPLPGFLAIALGHPLQVIATKGSIYVVQTLGIAAVAQGTVIQLAADKLDVQEACSGISMLMLFFAVCVGWAFLLDKTPLWERLLIVVSAIPIAIISNVARIAVAAILVEWVGTWAEHLFHDKAGWVMMILAMGLLWAEMTLISKLLLAPPSEAPLILVDTPGPMRGDTA